MRQFIIKILEKIHIKIFGHEMSEMMRKFLYNVLWSFFGVFLSATILFAINIIAGRILGPEGYGKYNLVLAIMAFVFVFICLGFDTTAVKFISESPDDHEKNRLMSNSIIVIIFSSLLVFTLLFIFHIKLASLLKTDNELIIWAIVFAIFYSFKNTLDGFIKALNKFKFQAMIKIAEALAVLLFFLIFFIFLKKTGYQYFLLSIILGSFFAILIYFLKIQKRLRSWNNITFQKVRGYLKMIFLFGIIGITIANIDKFFIMRFMGPRDLGIYSAYLLSSVAVVSQFILLTNNVFFPMVNQVKDKKQIAKKIDRLSLFSFIPIVLIISLTSYIVVKLFGSQYGINWFYILLVSFISFMQIMLSFYSSVIGSSQKLFTFNTRIYYFKPIFVICLYFLIYKLEAIGIIPVFLILIASCLYDAINTRITLKYVEI